VSAALAEIRAGWDPRGRRDRWRSPRRCSRTSLRSSCGRIAG